MSNRRTGKIASLPFALRTQLNEKLRDGVKYEVIITWLESNDVFGVNEQNLTNWFQGGYADWLREQERLADMQARREFAAQMVNTLKDGGETHITQANELILASQINEVLSDFDPNLLKELLAEKPAKFLQLAMAVNSQTSERTKREKLELEYAKFRQKVQEQKEAIQATLSKAKSDGGIAPETLAEIENQLKLL